MDKPMEHLKQWHNLYQGLLTPNETAVYFELFMLGNQRYWPEWIEITDLNLSLSANINVRTIPDVVNSLTQKGLIESKRGKGKAKSGYKITPFVKDKCAQTNYAKNDVIIPRYDRDKSEISPRLEENSPCESKAGECSKTQHNIDTTQHKESKEKALKKQYAENVFLTEDEYSKLTERLNGNTSAVSWCIEKLDNSKGAKGYKYKSDYRAILNWVIDDYVKKHGKLSTCQSDYPVHQGDDDFGLPEAV